MAIRQTAATARDTTVVPILPIAEPEERVAASVLDSASVGAVVGTFVGEVVGAFVGAVVGTFVGAVVGAGVHKGQKERSGVKHSVEFTL
jgi:outer membrane lipoprotein SlyB